MEDKPPVSSSELDLYFLQHQHVKSECLVPVDVYGSPDIIKGFFWKPKIIALFLRNEITFFWEFKPHFAIDEWPQLFIFEKLYCT